VLCLAFVMLLSATCALAADGTFLGKVVDPPAGAPVTPGWIFVQGRNNMLRRVEVAHAEIFFGEDVPVSQRHKCNAECLSPGQEVRVTAHQDTAGEWQAKQVEILKTAAKTIETPLQAETLPNFSHFLFSLQVTQQGEFCIASSTE
jgi:hypothetical protein